MLSNHGLDDALQQQVSTENTKQRFFLSSSPNTAALEPRNPVSSRIHHKKFSAYDNKRKTLCKTYCIQILLLKWDV
jgi:hypothetical protein